MKKQTTAFLETIIAICIILDCESVWKWMHGSGYFRLMLSLCFITSLLCLLIIKKNGLRRKEYIAAVCIGLYLAFFLIYNMFANSARTVNTVEFVTTIALMLLALHDTKIIRDVMQRCSTVLCFMAAASLFFWLFGSVCHILKPMQTLTVYVNNIPLTKPSYFYIQYEMQQEEVLGFSGLYRNTGIFLEGPKYVLIISLLLAYELFIATITSYKRCIVFSLVILSTMAMTGIYAVCLIWVLWLFVHFPAKTTKNLIMRTCFIVALFFTGIQIVPYLNDSFSVKTNTASYNTRMDNYQAGFAAWLEKPLMGYGYQNMDGIIAHYSSFRSNDVGYSNSIFRILAQGGLYLFSIFLTPIGKAIKDSIQKKDSKKAAFILIYLYYFITTSFPYSYLNYIVLLMLFFVSSTKKKVK